MLKFPLLTCITVAVLLGEVVPAQYRVTDEVFFDITIGEKDLGRVVIGLFSDLAPKAVHNFKVLADVGINGQSYKGTTFFKVIKRFMIQGGDIIHNNGSGVISVYGDTFETENIDTSNTVAGFVSMLNTGENTNGCQFLITTVGAPWIDNLYTVIGKVVEGKNLIHVIEHTATDVNDKPLQDIYIKDSGVQEVENPYYISDEPYGLKEWIKATAVPLSMSFCILGFFQWMISKMNL